MSIKYANILSYLKSHIYSIKDINFDSLSISILKSHIYSIKKRVFVKQKPAFLWNTTTSPLP